MGSSGLGDCFNNGRSGLNGSGCLTSELVSSGMSEEMRVSLLLA